MTPLAQQLMSFQADDDARAQKEACLLYLDSFGHHQQQFTTLEVSFLTPSQAQVVTLVSRDILRNNIDI